MFRFTKLEIPGLLLIESDKYEDERGFFTESYKHSLFSHNGIQEAYNQDNISLSRKGVLRGLHYQVVPKAQGKLVRALSGKVFDVAVDIRKGSPYFGKWAGIELSAENNRIIWIPEGFAHGFQSLEENSLVMYKTTHEYSQEHERGIIWNDPDIRIHWPIDSPFLSERDKNLPELKDAEYNFIY